MYALARSEDVGLISLGEKVVLKYQDLPHYYYGTMKGKIVAVAESSDAKGLYPLKISISDYGKLENRVTKGMMGVASIIIEEKPVIHYVFKAFLEKVTFE